MKNNIANNRYPQGYLPKIAYHLAMGNTQKAEYFVERQKETYGPLEPGQLIEVMDQVRGIERQWAEEQKEFNSHLGRF